MTEKEDKSMTNEWLVTKNFDDREIMDDILTSEKHVTSTYNSFCNECVNMSLKSDFLNILQESHNMQSNVFSQMHQKGWYQPAQASQQQVTQAKTKFQGISSQLQ